MKDFRRRGVAGFAAVLVMLGVAERCGAQEAAIRKNIGERLPKFPKIDEVTKSTVPGLYELRVGNDILYTDENGDYVIEGTIIDTKAQVNLTQSRVDKLTAIDFAALPFKDAIVWKQGTGARKLAVFADPNCGFCKQFEGDLGKVKDLTVYTFLMPILGGDSPQKSHNIWCAPDAAASWRHWMLQGIAPSRIMGPCDDSAIARNLALGKRHQITLTPSLVFEDGKRFKGLMPLDQVERQLATGKPKS
jgi:thiol:disulfide interchange protein DsbC